MIINSSRSWGIIYFLLSITCSALGDVMTKYLALTMHQSAIVAAKFALSVLLLIPFSRKVHLRKNFKVHITRVSLLALGALIWTQGLQGAQIATATIIKFTIPLLTMAFAYIFLKENVLWHQWVAAMFGFGGIVLCMSAGNRLDLSALLLMAGAVMFSLLDTLNKAYVGKISNFETMLSNALFITILLAPLAWLHWKPLNVKESIVLTLLGIDSLLIIFFLLKALEKTDLSILAPCRYMELIITTSSGYLIFGERPSGSDWLAAMIVICSSMWPLFQKRLATLLDKGH